MAVATWADRMPASWPAAVGTSGTPPSTAPMRRPQVAVELHRGRRRFLGQAENHALATGGPAGDVARPRPPPWPASRRRGHRASNQPSTRAAMALVALGCTATLAKVARAPCRSAADPGLGDGHGANGSMGSLRSASSGSCRRGWARPRNEHRHLPCGQMPVAKPIGAPRSGQGPALLDVQLDEGAERAPAAVGPAPVGPGRRPARCHGLRPRSYLRASASARAASGWRLRTQSRLPTQATPNRAPSSSEKHTTATRAARRGPVGPQLVDRQEPRRQRPGARRRRRRWGRCRGGCRWPPPPSRGGPTTPTCCRCRPAPRPFPARPPRPGTTAAARRRLGSRPSRRKPAGGVPPDPSERGPHRLEPRPLLDVVAPAGHCPRRALRAGAWSLQGRRPAGRQPVCGRGDEPVGLLELG